MDMANRIRDKRLEHKMTQEELANKLGLQKSAIAKYENGRVRNIKRAVIQRMAEIFDCSPAWLMGIDDDSLAERSVNIIQKMFSDDDLEHMKIYSQLDFSDRALVNNMILTILNQDKYKEKKYTVREDGIIQIKAEEEDNK